MRLVLKIGSRGDSDRIFLVKSESPGNITWCASNSFRVWVPVPNRRRVSLKDLSAMMNVVHRDVRVLMPGDFL